MPVVELTTKIAAPIERCFDLARSIDLHKLSMIGTREEAIAGVTSGLIGLGDTVTWRARHFGLMLSLTSKITAFEYPVHFRDEMVRGPFRMIRHDHRFLAVGKSTTMHDVFEFQSPAGWAGDAFNILILTNYLRRMLRRRNLLIKELAEGDRWNEFTSPSEPV